MQRQLPQQQPPEFNSISGLTSQSPQAVLEIFLSCNSTLKQIIDALFEC